MGKRKNRVGLWDGVQHPGAYEDADSTSEPDVWRGDLPGSGQQQRPEMRKVSLSGLDHLKGPPWSEMPRETMLVSVVHAAAQALMKSEIHVEVRGLSCYLRP